MTHGTIEKLPHGILIVYQKINKNKNNILIVN
jgi:hypothetical protein